MRIVCAAGPTEVVYCGLAVDAGTRDELDTESGMAHFTEHLSFKGTHRRKAWHIRPFGVTGKEMEHRLDEVHITANKNAIPNDPEKPFVTSGIRVGTPAVTSRGFGVEEMKMIAKWMKLVATDFEANKEKITAEVIALCEKYPIYN